MLIILMVCILSSVFPVFWCFFPPLFLFYVSFCVPVCPPLQRWGSDWVCSHSCTSFPQSPDWRLNFGSLPLFAGLLLFTHVVMTLAFCSAVSSTAAKSFQLLCLHASVFLIRFNPTTTCVFLRALGVDKYTVKPRLSWLDWYLQYQISLCCNNKIGSSLLSSGNTVTSLWPVSNLLA